MQRGAIAVTRPAIEPSVVDDPAWTGRRGIDLAGRLVEGYVGAQFRFIELTYGQLDHNWGPAGLPGIPLSNYGYERQGLMLSLMILNWRQSNEAGIIAPTKDTADNVQKLCRAVAEFQSSC